MDPDIVCSIHMYFAKYSEVPKIKSFFENVILDAHSAIITIYASMECAFCQRMTTPLCYHTKPEFTPKQFPVSQLELAHFLIHGVEISLQLTNLLNKLKASSVIYPNPTTYGLYLLPTQSQNNNYEESNLIFGLMKSAIKLFQLQHLTPI